MAIRTLDNPMFADASQVPSSSLSTFEGGMPAALDSSGEIITVDTTSTTVIGLFAFCDDYFNYRAGTSDRITIYRPQGSLKAVLCSETPKNMSSSYTDSYPYETSPTGGTWTAGDPLYISDNGKWDNAVGSGSINQLIAGYVLSDVASDGDLEVVFYLDRLITT